MVKLIHHSPLFLTLPVEGREPERSIPGLNGLTTNQQPHPQRADTGSPSSHRFGDGLQCCACWSRLAEPRSRGRPVNRFSSWR